MATLTHSTDRGVSGWRGGSGRTLLFLHAAGTGADALRRLAEPFAEDRRVLVPDFPGYGGSASDPAREPVAERLALVEALLDECEGCVDLVGHSMGGFIALQAALRWPERIGRVVAVEPVAFGAIATGEPADEAALAIDRAAAESLVRLYDRGEREAGIAAFISLWNGTAWADLPPGVRAGLLALGPTLRREVPAVSFEQTPAAAYAHLGERLCLIVGEYSPAPAQRIVLRLAEAVPGARLVRIAGTGHMGLVQKPALFLPAIADFLRGGEAANAH